MKCSNNSVQGSAMPTILCHSCEKPTTLPESWSKPTYTCPHCATVVSLVDEDRSPVVVSEQAPATPTHPQPVYYTAPTPTPQRSAFGTMAGGAMGLGFGCVMFFVGLVVVIALFFALISR